MKSIVLIILIALSGNGYLQAQHQANSSPEFSIVLKESILATSKSSHSPVLLSDGQAPRQKSRFLGSMFSLLLPGMGELYAGKFERGHVPLILEGLLWLGLAGFNYYGGWIEDDARNFASQHSGANFSGKNDGFDVDIENFDDVYAYNNAKLINRDINALYSVDPADGYYWSWDSKDNRKKFEDLRIKSDEMFNATSFIVLGMIANRIWSAVKASLAVRDHNRELPLFGVLPDIRTRIISYQGQADGIQLEFSQKF